MTFGSLFAGRGGMDLGLERAGMVCKWQVEIDEDARRVLAKHWPHVQRWDDVRTFARDRFVERVDVIAGGFPCQDISSSGGKAGITGERSGLWTEYLRIIRTLRPHLVIVENVPAITSRGLGVVLGNLATSGFDAEWDCLPAAAFGSPQRRWRMFIVAYAHGWRQQRREKWNCFDAQHQGWDYRNGLDMAQRAAATAASRVRRMDGRVPRRVDRLRIEGCGNSVYPAVAEFIGRKLMEVA